MFEKLKKIFSKFEEKNESKLTELYPVANGKYVKLTDVKDPAFSSLAMGNGFAVELEEKEGLIDILSPIDGSIKLVFPSKHAIGIVNDKGINVLIHIGIETVGLDGKGFETLVNVGDSVSKGQPLVSVNLDVLNENNLDTTTMVVVLPESNTNTLNILNNYKTGDKLEMLQPVVNVE
ncbi:PTS glucose transporter subunit IIA [Mycoplasma sp. CSL10137]|uniref:PTS sugar transporter subunit IIA n=1 Tax=unclassified Mycoplasma TaxID=2683645 RepID=UPI00197BC206|nr:MULTISPECIES: PTS glucose transporter subunit IIA [unclassified Mycoplasma]MBN4083799.1 PTS glucose transporter subunit IIA [Mycoplasma sp. CSL10137]MBN4084235.1 PTS glucose transporter subunit IIA [Mycoplasma sp. CSL10166]MBU4692696.1 PTS glucose transporter subunit IIA [Mycoplasma sp. CSL7491-lung]